jgi:hypothetical protein
MQISKQDHLNGDFLFNHIRKFTLNDKREENIVYIGQLEGLKVTRTK